MYSALPYAFAQVLIELPYVFAQAAVYSVIAYAMIGFEWTAVKFFWYLFFMYLTLLYFIFYGMMTVAVSPNQQIPTVIAFAFYGIWNVFSGFIIPKPDPQLVEVSPVAWTLYGQVASQYGDILKLIDTGDNSRVSVKQFIEHYFDFKHDFLGWTASIIVSFAVVFAFTFAYSIREFNFQRG